MPPYAPPEPAQRPRELERLIAIARAEGVRRYLEVGARHGGTFHAVVRSLPAGSTALAVDLPGAAWGRADSARNLKAAAADLGARGYHVRLVWGDSHAPDTIAQAAALAPYDLVLIDADHSYEAVRQDWHDYGPLGRMVAFHDIDGPGLAALRPEYAQRVQVPRLWDEIKGGHVYDEIIDFNQRGMGIGLLWREVAP